MERGMSNVVRGFLEYQAEVRKLRPRTIVDIRCTLRSLQSYCASELKDQEIWRLPLNDYIRWVNRLQERGQSTKSINKMLSHVRSLIDYAWQMEKLDRNVLDGFYLKGREETPIYDQLSIEEARRLITAFGKANSKERWCRTIMVLLYGCGLRTQELCDLDVSSIDLDRQEIQVIGKGQRRRVIPVSDAVFAELVVYLRDRKGKRGSLFKTEIKGARLNSHVVSGIVRAAAERSGIKKEITPRTLRHAFASHLLDQGVDIAVIAMLMGHRSPSETGVYIHAQEKNLRAAVYEMPVKEDGK